MVKKSSVDMRGNSIFVVPALDSFLLFAPLHGITALLNESAVDLLKRGLQNGKDSPAHGELTSLIEQLRTPATRNPDRTGGLDPQFLGIIPSRRCNMSCIYCDFGEDYGREQTIDPDRMIAAIDYYAELTWNSNRRVLSIQFFGGEPFAEPEIIDIAVHHTRFVASKIGLIPHFEVLTNGCFSERQRRFVRDYFDRVVVSFDGFQKYHDRMRPMNSHQGSYDQVAETIRYLSDSSVDLAIRCCITSDSVNEMEAMAQWFCTEFQPDKVNFETLTPNSRSAAAGLFPPDPYEFAGACIRSWRILRDHMIEPVYAPVSLDTVQTTSCPVGRDVLIVHPDGTVASCYLHASDWASKNLDLSVGHVSPQGHVEIDFEKMKHLRNLVYNKPRCANCFCRFSCAGNCHVNCTYPGSSAKYIDFCTHTRIITVCCLLENLGLRGRVDELLADPPSLQALSLHASDTLFHFKEEK
ncbi:MAG: radical SAM protein [Candidatus Zhuqueibacterota bacterium]